MTCPAAFPPLVSTFIVFLNPLRKLGPLFSIPADKSKKKKKGEKFPRIKNK